MSNFMICVNAVVPIFLLIATGYGAKRAGFIREEEVPRMNAVAFKVFMPLMCFYNLYNSNLSSAVRPGLIAFAVLGVLAAYALSLCYAVLFVRQRNRKGVVIQGIYRSNFLIIGFPFAAGLVGEMDLGVVAVLSAIVVPIFNVLAVVTLEAYNGKTPEIRKLLFEIVKNPLIQGSVVGIVFLAAGIRLPASVEKAVGDLSGIASPLLLFLLGAFFKLGGFRAHIPELMAVCLGRLVVIPALALSAAVWLGFRGIEFVTLLGIFASSTAANSFTMAQQMGGDPDLAGDIVVLTSALCSFTLFAWSLLFKQMGIY